MTGLFGAIWGIAGVILLLGYAIVRLTPIVIEALGYELNWYHWGVLVINLLVVAYAEGYRGFQQGFSPRVAARAKYLSQHPNLWHSFLAPFYCLGYFQTTPRRQRATWLLTAGIILLILLVHRLAQPWRGIIDAGVVVGLAWGLVSLLIYSGQAFWVETFAHSPEVSEKQENNRASRP